MRILEFGTNHQSNVTDLGGQTSHSEFVTDVILMRMENLGSHYSHVHLRTVQFQENQNQNKHKIRNAWECEKQLTRPQQQIITKANVKMKI